MIRLVHNSKLLLMFYLCIFVLIALSFLPIYEWGTESNDAWIIFCGNSLLIIIYLLISRPAYAGLEIMNNTLYVTTDNEEDNKSWVEIPLDELVDFKIVKSFFGLNKKIFFIRLTEQGFQKSKETNISLFSKSMIVKIEKMLTPFKKAELKL